MCYTFIYGISPRARIAFEQTTERNDRKMKIFVFSYRDFDEAEFFTEEAERTGVTLGICRTAPTQETIGQAAGYDCISILTTPLDAPLLREIKRLGIRMISTRTIGYDHIDIKEAAALGLKVSNASYSPNGVADYAIMLMLMASRKMKRIMQRSEIQDYTLSGIQGRELSEMTVGIVGTGRIGRTVARHLSGFGCKVLACDPYENEETRAFAQYVPLDEVWRRCDLISLHMPLTDENYHMIGRETIAKMKDRVILVNTARGPLVDSDALIEGIESGKIGAAALDVVEDEFGMYYYDRKSDVLQNRALAVLKSFPNVIVTPHMAFYTDRDVRDMIHASVESCLLEEAGKENPWKVL